MVSVSSGKDATLIHLPSDMPCPFISLYPLPSLLDPSFEDLAPLCSQSAKFRSLGLGHIVALWRILKTYDQDWEEGCNDAQAQGPLLDLVDDFKQPRE